ncbi:multiple coagulation factor deficiency protein 2 homolog isoform X2 [Procambarus clarkii]|uniref:multiple coagulation factor deficiency protein 2 homolog isoform X2 n=1 Tax=Procambarus clarkii TaxID=6728 RepID=UPI0037446452
MRWVQAVACLLLAAAVHMHAMDPIQEFMNHDHSQHGQVHEQGQEQHVQGHAEGRHEEEQSDLHLTEHLAEHIRHQAHLNLAAMSTTEKLFHLFLSHDYDSDHLLDGIELIQSLGDGASLRLLSDDDLSNKIDFLLNNFDADQDGKLSFPEYMRSVMAAAPPPPLT